MYGTQEHTYQVRRLGDAARDVDAAFEILGQLRGEMMMADLAATQDARNQVRAARRQLASARELLDQAVALLPAPSRDAGLR